MSIARFSVRFNPRRWRAGRLIATCPIPLMVILAVILSYSAGCFWGLPSEVTAAYDASAAYSSLAHVAKFSDPSFDYAYPVAHKIFLLPFLGVVIAVGSLLGLVGTPTGDHPYGFQYPVETISTLFVVSQLVSVLMAASAVAIMVSVRAGEYRRVSYLFTYLLLSFGGVITYYSRTMNYDAPYLFWWAIAYALVWKALVSGDRSLRTLALSAMATAMAVGTKDQAVGLALGIFVCLLSCGAGQREEFRSRLNRSMRWMALALASYGVLILLWPPSRFYLHVSRFGETLAGAGRADPTSVPMTTFLGDFFSSLVRSTSIPGLGMAIAGIVMLLRTRRGREAGIPLTVAGAYFLFPISAFRLPYERFLIPFALLAAPFITAGVDRIIDLSSRVKLTRLSTALVGAVLVAILVTRVAFGYGPITALQLYDVKRQLARDIHRHIPQGQVIYFDDPYQHLPNADVYRRYRFYTPDMDAVSRPARHVYVDGNDLDGRSFAFLLTTQGSRHDIGNFDLVASWTIPRYAKKYSRPSHAIFEYFLYRRRSNAGLDGP